MGRKGWLAIKVQKTPYFASADSELIDWISDTAIAKLPEAKPMSYTNLVDINGWSTFVEVKNLNSANGQRFAWHIIQTLLSSGWRMYKSPGFVFKGAYTDWMKGEWQLVRD